MKRKHMTNINEEGSAKARVFGFLVAAGLAIVITAFAAEITSGQTSPFRAGTTVLSIIILVVPTPMVAISGIAVGAAGWFNKISSWAIFFSGRPIARANHSSIYPRREASVVVYGVTGTDCEQRKPYLCFLLCRVSDSGRERAPREP
jgi:hypothetical protein